MASKNQADTSQKPSGEKAKKLSQKEQSERFIEAARKLEADVNGKDFEAATKTILKAKNS
ncbi:hypothetical protein J5J10_22260 [Ciceribacter sp. L1K23]|uniref:hypothetical protein n=1 Tax=Ciceribacter sp. L1K23 TaxID=2820276 RepID=UPI001B826C0E|nr:hypothetical protein [Ciceribacter sp. L1K23]MBR0558429.1 hypothetical protein [Ciceribacter sp. L1K23]